MKSKYEGSVTAVVGLNLPNSWIQTTIGKVTKISSGGTPSTKRIDYFNGSVPWITPADLSVNKSKYISKGARNISETGLKHSSAVLLPKGTVVFSSRAPIGYVAIAANELATNQGCKNFLPSDCIFNEYLYYFLKASKPLAERYASGTTFSELSAKNAAKIPIPLPPIAEQHRIAAKINELLTRLDVGVGSLRKMQTQLKLYRQSVLKRAFQGKLTQLWKDTNKDIIDPPSFLLESIEENNANDRGNGYKIGRNTIRGLTNLPEQWRTITLGAVSECLDHKRIPVKLAERNIRRGEIPYYGASGQTGWIDDYLFDEPLLLVAEDGENLNSRKLPIAYSITGKSWVNNHAHVLRIKYIKQQFVEYFINSMDISPFLTGTTRPKLNKSSLLDIAIPLPSIQEQNQLIDEIERRFAASHIADKLFNKTTKEAEILRRSILGQAFEGKLVPQDPNDQPADRLPEHILGEKLNQRRNMKVVKDETITRTSKGATKEASFIQTGLSHYGE